MRKIIDELGGLTAVARMTGVRVPSVSGWVERGIPAERCADLERLSGARVVCEDMRPDLRWVRVRDKAWPHPKGRPCVDVAAPEAA